MSFQENESGNSSFILTDIICIWNLITSPKKFAYKSRYLKEQVPAGPLSRSVWTGLVWQLRYRGGLWLLLSLPGAAVRSASARCAARQKGRENKPPMHSLVWTAGSCHDRPCGGWLPWLSLFRDFSSLKFPGFKVMSSICIVVVYVVKTSFRDDVYCSYPRAYDVF